LFYFVHICECLQTIIWLDPVKLILTLWKSNSFYIIILLLWLLELMWLINFDNIFVKMWLELTEIFLNMYFYGKDSFLTLSFLSFCQVPLSSRSIVMFPLVWMIFSYITDDMLKKACNSEQNNPIHNQFFPVNRRSLWWIHQHNWTVAQPTLCIYFFPRLS